MGIIGYTITPGRVKNYSFAFFSAGAPTGQVLGNLMVSDFCLSKCAITDIVLLGRIYR